jgi:hypothetical protein
MILTQGTLDALQQRIYPRDQQRSVSAFGSGIRQGSLIAGGGLAGGIIHLSAPTAGFILSSLSACVAATLALFLPSALKNERDRGSSDGGYFSDLYQGGAYILQSPEILRPILLTALAFSIGQMSNAVLAGFIQKDVGGTSALYGLVDASWSVGGLMAAASIVALLRKYRLRHADAFSCIMLGATTVAFGTLNDPVAIVLTCGVLGAFFSSSKMLCDGSVLEICDSRFVGRVRSNTQMLISVFGVFSYTSPTLFGVESARVIFFWGGGCVAVASFLIAAASFVPRSATAR